MNLRLVVAVIISLSIFSCEKQTEKKPVGEYVIDTAILGNIQASLIKLALGQQDLSQFNKYFKYDILINKISYTTNYKGEDITASGLVCFPKNLDNPLPILLIQNGLAFSDIYAPTSFEFPDHFLGYEFLASLGFVIILPDMIGFGESDEYIFPIYHAGYSVSTNKDMLTATEEYLSIKNIELNNKMFMGGYSMGGYVSSVLQEAFEKDPDFKYTIGANAVGAGGYDLLTLMDSFLEKDSFDTPSHLALIFSSYNDSYEWNRDLTTYFSDKYASEIPEIISGKYTRQEADSLLTTSLKDLLNPSFLSDLRTHDATYIIDALKENSIDDWKPEAPIRLYHSEKDERFPFSDSQNAYNNMVANGSTSASLVKIGGEDHFDAVYSFMEQVLPWFDSLRQQK